MKLLLAYTEYGLGEAWREYVRGQPDIKILYRIAARQMFYAYEDIILQKKRKLDNFGDAQKFQIELNPTGMLYN